jgi:30S ribosomal protein S1
MTLLDLAKRCGETIQVVAQAIEDEFKDKISLSSNTHVPDKYVSTIITKFRGPLSSSAQSKPLVPKKSSVSTAQTYGEESGGVTYRLATLAKDLNVSISSIVEHFDHIFQGNLNPNSRVNEDLAKSIIRYFGKEYLIHVPSTTKKSKKNKTQKKKDSSNAKQSDSGTEVQEIKIQKTKLSGKALLKHLKSAVNKRILTGTIVNYDRSRDAYFVEVMGFKSLLYSSEVNTDRKLDSGEEIEVVPLKVDGHKVIEYMTVSMRRAWEIANNKQSKRPRKQQLELEFDQLEIGSEITGCVSRVEDNYVIVEYNNLHGIIYKKDLFWSRVCRIDFYWKVNAPIRAKVISKEVIDGKLLIRFSHKECIPNIWKTLDLKIEENEYHETEEASVVEVNDNGVILSLAYDMEGLLPSYELSYEEFQLFSNGVFDNKLISAYIKKFDAKKQFLILTRQPYYDYDWEDACSRYIPNRPYCVDIIGTTNDCIWVKFEDNIESKITKSEFAWENTQGSGLVFHVGDSINVLVKKVDPEKHKIEASIKELTPDPWTLVDENIKGCEIEVKVNGLRNGKFLMVETLDNLHLLGIIRLSEVSWQYSSTDLPDSLLPSIGETISAKVIIVDKTLRRLSLSIRQLSTDPWYELEPGATVRGKLGSVTSAGDVEVILENGLKAISNETELLSMEKDTLDFKVLDCSRQTKRIMVSHNQLLYDRTNDIVIANFFSTSKI